MKAILVSILHNFGKNYLELIPLVFKNLVFYAVMLLFGSSSFAQNYCLPVYSVGCNGSRNIHSFELIGINQSGIFDFNTQCAAGSYDNKTYLPAAQLYPGFTHTGSISSQSLYSAEYVKIWIDFDDDGFSDSLDLVGKLGPIGPTATPFTITIPMFVDTGLHRMRVRSAGPNYGYNFDDCGGYLYGETHDYLIEIVYPTCSIPYSLMADNITTNSANLSWQEAGITTQWQVAFGMKGFSPGMARDTIVQNNSPSIVGLQPNTSYDFYVRSVCGRTDTSFWAGPFNFQTKCLIIDNFPYVENFDGQSIGKIEDCWTIINKDGAYSWKQGNTWLTAKSPPYLAHSGGGSDDMLITPELVLPAQDMQLLLWDIVANASMNSIYKVLVSTTGTDSSDFTDTLATFNVTNEQWTQRIIDLSAYSNQSIHIALWLSYSASPYWPLGVDDFTIDYLTGAESIDKNTVDISISPNPSNGVFKIKASSIKTDLDVEIYNSFGKEVYRSRILSSHEINEVVDISDLSQGIYFAQLQSDSVLFTKKIVIQ